MKAKNSLPPILSMLSVLLLSAAGLTLAPTALSQPNNEQGKLAVPLDAFVI